MTDLNWPRLGSYVARRRVELKYATTRDLANAMTAAGTPISEKTLGRLERGESVNRNTVAKVEEWLGWAPGSAQSILRGGEPTLMAGSANTEAAAVRAARAAVLAMTPDELAEMKLKIQTVSGPEVAEEWLRKAIELRRSNAVQQPSSPQTTRREVG